MKVVSMSRRRSGLAWARCSLRKRAAPTLGATVLAHLSDMPDGFQNTNSMNSIDALQVLDCIDRQIGAFREGLTENAVGVLVRATLPRTCGDGNVSLFPAGSVNIWRRIPVPSRSVPIGEDDSREAQNTSPVACDPHQMFEWLLIGK